VFLDRDGTVIHDVGYPRDPAEVRLLPGAGEALAGLQERGFVLVLVSNQSGIGRGLIKPEEAARVHQRVVEVLTERGVRLDAAHYCPHAPEAGCECRKPSPHMLLQAAEQLHLDLRRSFLVGDKPSDIEAGRRAGCRTVLLLGHPEARRCEPAPDAVADDWPAVLTFILQSDETTA
jgi:histidinol-phosphate phosphatase family protein